MRFAQLFTGIAQSATPDMQRRYAPDGKPFSEH